MISKDLLLFLLTLILSVNPAAKLLENISNAGKPFHMLIMLMLLMCVLTPKGVVLIYIYSCRHA